jgi:transcriptional regulator with XRE-family HTH domain
VPALDVRHLGDFIREQRESSKISVRELAKTAGVSNPYLSQIERGLRKPSAQILQQIAKGLRISAEVLYVQAGILDERDASPVVDAILADESLNERQKQVLLEIHDSFRKENAALHEVEASAAPAKAKSKTPSKAPAKKAARKAKSTPVTTTNKTEDHPA